MVETNRTQLDKKEQLQIQKNKKPVDLREEYFVRLVHHVKHTNRANKSIRDYKARIKNLIIGRTSEYA